VVRRRILFGIVFAVLFGIGWGVGRGRASGDLYRNLDTFIEVLHAVQTSYVDPVEPRPLVEGALHGLLRSLDPYSDYLTPHEMDAQRGSLDEDFEGVGVLLDMHRGAPVVVAPIEGSPAWEAGLLPGDVISKLDGHSTFGLGLPEIGARFHGEPGTTLAVTVMRSGFGEQKEFVVKRGRVAQRSVPFAFLAEPGIGYVRIARFGAGAATELAAALDTLRAAGARAVVLDLRGNPGGLVEQAVGVVAPFVREGSLVVSTKGRANPEHKWLAPKSRAAFTGPVAVLVDGASASAAEIVAGALQDLDRAIVVGQPTFGKGMVQDFYPLRNREGALRLTTSYYYTASGRSLERSHAGDVAAADDGGDEADSAAVDSTPPKAVFHSASGRVVRAGGVEPDLETKPDSLPALARAVLSQRLAFAFASRWAPQHGAAADDAALAAFRDDVVAHGVAVTDAAWSESRVFVTTDLRRELARRADGPAAAMRVSLPADPDWLGAVAVLRRARTARDVFAFAVPVPDAPATVAAPRKTVAPAVPRKVAAPAAPVKGSGRGSR
jgi:carboxyl-terminal processing protease